MASVSTLGAPVRLYIARREAKSNTHQADSVTAVACCIFQYVLVELRASPVLLACVTAQSRSVADAFDALPGVPVKSPNILANVASFARMTVETSWKKGPDPL